MRLSIPVVAAASLFWGVFLLELALPIMLAIGATAFLLACYGLYKLRADTVALLVFANFGLWLGTAFFVGSVSPGDLATPRFFSGDGRIFLYYLPLLLFSVITATRRDLMAGISLLKVLAVACFGLMCVWVISPRGLSTSKFFTGFISTHTAAGTFFGAIATSLLIYGVHLRSLRIAVFGALALLPTVASGSREAMLSIIAVAGWYVIITRRFRLAVGLMAAGLVGIAALPVISPSAYARTKVLVAPETWSRIQHIIKSTPSPMGFVKSEGGSEGEVNALNRILFWLYAAGRIEASPIVGIGFGRLNDIGVQLTPYAGVAKLGFSGVKVLNTANAHNSYLQLLAENGIVGLALLLSVWLVCYLRLGALAKRMSMDKEIQAFCVMGQSVIIFTLSSSMVGHALGAPAIGFPVLAVTGLALAYDRRVARQAAREPTASGHLAFAEV
jgi:O-antigen ligase